jgi:glycyl-tRNA synthetase beta subunit
VDGEPSKALAGFCKKNGVKVEEVTREDEGRGVDYVWAIRHQDGLPAVQVQHQITHVKSENLIFLMGPISNPCHFYRQSDATPYHHFSKHFD